MFPDYVDCKNQEFEHCDYLMHNDCPGTCAFYKDIGGIEEVVLGCGALMIDSALISKIYKD